MKINLIAGSLLWCCVFSLVISCAKEDVSDMPLDPVFPGSQELVEASVHGKVVDEFDRPLSGAVVRCMSCRNELSTTTDDSGLFKMFGIENGGSSVYLEIEYSGMFKSFRRLGVREREMSYTEIKMLSMIPAGTIKSSEGGTISLDSGASVSLPANGIVDTDSNDFEGEYNVFISWIDPTREDIDQIMIGDLSGLNLNGELQALSSMGMLQVELVSLNGAPLNLKAGFEAELNFPIPDDLISFAESTIPLWSYNETVGVWVEESTATIVGDSYIGTVTHFSSFNVDYKTDPINISGAFLIWNGIAQIRPSRLQVFVTFPDGTRKGGWTTHFGNFLFFNFPKNQSFVLSAYNACGGLVYSESYDGFQVDRWLGNLSLDQSLFPNMINITGNITTCDSEPVGKGFVELNYFDSNNRANSIFYPLQLDGSFNIVHDYCEEDKISIQGFDLNNNRQSSELFFTSPFSGKIDVGQLLTCDAFDQFIRVNIDGVIDTTYLNGLYFPISQSSLDISFSRSIIQGADTLLVRLNIPIPKNTPEQVSANDFNLKYHNDNCNCTDYAYLSEENGNTIEVNVQSYDPDMEDKFIGTFSGTITLELSNEVKQISGAFQL